MRSRSQMFNSPMSTDAARISFTHYNGAAGQKLLPETMSGGVCVLDYDRDGRQDVLFVNSCSWPGHPGPEKPASSCLTLYRNKGDGTFEDVTESAGLTVTMYRRRRVLGRLRQRRFPRSVHHRRRRLQAVPQYRWRER